MSVDFLSKAKKENRIVSKKVFNKQIDELYLAAKSNGLSVQELATILGTLKNLELDGDTFRSLVRCLIPNEVIPNSLLRKVMTWIFMSYREESEAKIESLLIWLASLLDFGLIDESIDEYYELIDCLLKYFPKPVSHILYKLTKSEDVTLRKVEKVREMLILCNKEPCLCALLNRYKELNSAFSYCDVPSYKKCEKVFSYKNNFYFDLRAALNNIVESSSNDTAASIVVPHKKMKKKFEEEVLPEPHYLPDEFRKQNSGYYIQDIKSATELMQCFNKLVLPSHSLSLIKSQTGIFVLMASKRSIQQNFLENLYAILNKNFISNPDSTSDQEKENLLNNVIVFHMLFQQGFLHVSKFLSSYLLFWDGYMFKKSIYSLLEWFVFQSETELNRCLLKPLFTLFISGDDSEMCDILLCLTNLITNLFSMLKKEKLGIKKIYEEKIIYTRDELIPVLQKLPKFFAHLCKIGLYIYPCNSKILQMAIEFYRKIDQLEDEDVSDRTIISSCVLYHTLLCFNGQLLNQVCALMPSYRDRMLAGEPSPIMNGRFNRLMGYVGDMINFLWTSKAFVSRMKGHIFYSVPVEHSMIWRNYVNLNNGLDILKHIMFEPQRSLAVLEEGRPCRQFTSKEIVLEILKQHFPHIAEFIETVLQNAHNSLIEDDEL